MLAEPCSPPKILLWDGDTPKAGFNPSIHPQEGWRGPRQPHGAWSRAPRIPAVCRSSKLPLPPPFPCFPWLESGRLQEERGSLAPPALGRSRPGRRGTARSQIRAAGARRFPRCDAQIKHGHGHREEAGLAWFPWGQGCSEDRKSKTGARGGSRTGAGGGIGTNKPHPCTKPRAERIPTTTTTTPLQGLRPLLSLQFPFILCIFYIHGIKPSSSTRLQQPDRPQGCSHQLGGSAQPGGVPGTPPVGTGTGGPSTTGSVEGGWPQKCWDGSIHQTDGERTPPAARGWRLSDCPKSQKTRELELPAVLEPSARCRAPSSRAKSFPAGNFPSVKKKPKTTKQQKQE